MGKRSRFSRRASLQEKQSDAVSDPPMNHEKTRLLLWAAVMVVATAGLSVAATLVAYHNAGTNTVVSGDKDPRAAEVEELIQRYFRTWSAMDMKGYGDCFLENSSIQYIDSNGKIIPSDLGEFLKSQGNLLCSGERETEVPESIDIRFEANLARVVVYWKLTQTAKKTEISGYDHFTLLKHDGKWGIVNLAFYETKRSG